MASVDELGTIHRNCPQCGRDNADVEPSEYSREPWILKSCAACDFLYVETAPDYDALFEQMGWRDRWAEERESRARTRPLQQAVSWSTRWRLKLLPKITMPAMLARHARPGNVLDLGCGSGKRLDALSEQFTPFGIEIETSTAEVANEAFGRRGGYAINAPCLHGLRNFPDGFFTAATLRSYLEHELHPKEVLKAVHRTLTDNGVAIVKVPNFASVNRRVQGRKWCGFRYPDHLNYFTPDNLRDMAADCGYGCSYSFIGRLPTSDNMYAVLTKR